MFKGCECHLCKAIALGTASLFVANYVYPTAYGDECWDQPKVGLYCQSFVPEQPHGPHGDQRPMQDPASVLTANSTGTLSLP
jgi:hypothetical protein